MAVGADVVGMMGVSASIRPRPAMKVKNHMAEPIATADSASGLMRPAIKVSATPMPICSSCAGMTGKAMRATARSSVRAWRKRGEFTKTEKEKGADPEGHGARNTSV